MDRYEYEPIDLSTDEIRLVYLCKGVSTDPIECDIFHVRLNEVDGVPYEALSYTWGDASELVQIKLSGAKAMITRNLFLALNSLRLRDADRLLWVDALCINQNNDPERGHQVSHMKQIYQNAEQVLIWLGELTGGVDVLMDFMNELESRAKLQVDYRVQSPQSWRIAWPLLVEEKGGTDAEDYRRAREALDRLLLRSWFQRVWVLQEAACARRATIVCGSRTISSRTFVLMPSFMELTLDNHAEAVLQIMPGHLRTTSWWSEKPKLETLLCKFQNSYASDTRDKVYALLGISSDAFDQTTLPANYEISVHQMVHNTMSYILFRKPHDPSVSPLPTCSLDQLVSMLEHRAFVHRMFLWALLESKEALAMRILDSGKLELHKAALFNQSPFSGSYRSKGFGVKTPMQLILSLKGEDGEVLHHLLTHQDFKPNDEVRNGSALCQAIETKSYKTVQTLLSRQDIDIEIGHHGTSPLVTAMKRSDCDMMKILLDHGADIESPDWRGRTPLGLAVEKADVVVLKLLLDRGTNLEAMDNLRYTPLGIASKMGNIEVMDLLLDAGADPRDKESEEALSPFTLAAESQEARDLLLARRANLVP